MGRKSAKTILSPTKLNTMFTNHGTLVTIVPIYVPDEFEPDLQAPPFSSSGAAIWDLILSVPMSVATADRVDTFEAIIKDGTNGIEKQASDIVKEWNDGSVDDVDMYIDFKDLNTNKTRSKSNDFLTNEPAAYLGSVRIVAKITPA